MQRGTRVPNKGRPRAQGLKTEGPQGSQNETEGLQGGIIVLLLHMISFPQNSCHFNILFHLFQRKKNKENQTNECIGTYLLIDNYIEGKTEI